MYSRELINQ